MMDQTPVHDHHNPDLLKMIPPSSCKLIEVGCSSGAMAREFKKINPGCDYFGIDVDQNYVKLALRYCNQAVPIDIEETGDRFFLEHKERDCWIFGDTLEHLKDPWRILRKIRENLPPNGCVVACIPNAQHWTVIAKLCMGDFRYENAGLFDRTHLRWFTRKTIFDLFQDTGFSIAEGKQRVFDEPGREKFLPLIGSMAKACGFDPNVAMGDAIPLQYVVKAVPA